MIASNFNDINDLYHYADHLYNAATDLTVLVNSIRQQLDDITFQWHDKQQERVANVIEEKADIIYDLATDLDAHSARVKKYLREITEHNEELKNLFRI